MEGGGNSSDSNDKVQEDSKITTTTSFSDIKDVPLVNTFEKSLSALNIKNTQELVEKINTEEKINLFLQLKEQDSSIKAEDFRRLLRSLEDEVVLKNLLEDKTLSQKEYDSLKTTSKLISNLKSDEFHSFLTFNQEDELSAEANEEYLKEQLIPFNNNLASYGKELLTIEEFKKLKEKVNALDDMFTDDGEALQNVVQTNTTSSTTKSVSARALDTVSVANNYTILNPVTELTVENTKPTQTESIIIQEALCRTQTQSFPQKVVGKNLLSNAFLTLDDTLNTFYINEKGLAKVSFYNISSESKNIEIKHRDKTIFSYNIPSKKTVTTYIPILLKDICSAYTITNNENINVSVNKLLKAKKLDKILDSTNNNYYFGQSISYSQYGERSSIYEFSLTKASSKKATLSQSTSLGSYMDMQYMLISPSNKIYIGELSKDKNIEFTEEIGKWTLISLGYKTTSSNNKFNIALEDSSNLDTLGVNYISTLPFMIGTSNYIHRHIKITTNDKTNRKKFIIGEMKKAEFATDGDDDEDYNAEITLSIDTNVAPRLELSETLQNTEFDTVRYQAYKCWIDNNKDISTFDNKGICSVYKKEFQNSTTELIDDEEKNIFIRDMLLPFSSLKKRLKWYSKWINKKMKDGIFKLTRQTYNNIYESWEDNITQVNSIRFPFSYHYSVTEKISGGKIHPIIPINMPVLALTKKRLSKTLNPLAFSYSAVDKDSLDNWALAGSVAKYVLNQSLAILTGNYVAFVCNNITYAKDIRRIQKNAEDDPIGDANLYLNRFSAQDQFYGLEDGISKLSTSGFANITNSYTAEDKALNYASVACTVAGVATAAYDLRDTAQNIYNGEYITFIEKLGALMDIYDNTTSIYEEAFELKEALENGTATKEQIDNFLKDKDISALVKNGKDVFGNIEEIETLGGIGSQGYNSLQSEAKYYYSDFATAKTRGVFEFKEVDSIPVSSVEVNLQKVHIIENYEGGDPAEIKLRTRVGVVSDKTPSYQGRFENSAPFMLDGKLLYENGSDGYETLPNLPFKGYLLRSENFYGVRDNTILDLADKRSLYNASYPTENNIASIYVEIGVFEGDGGGTDDDMIGVLSQTYYLEDIFNNAGSTSWTKNTDKKYVLHVQDFPVYTTENLQSSVEILDKDKREFQKEHNKTAKNNPSAKISFDIVLGLGDFVENEVVEIKDYLNEITFKSEDDVLDITKLNLKEISYLSLENTKLFAHNKDKTRYIMYGNNTISIVKLDEDKSLSLEKTVKREQLETKYQYLLDNPSDKETIESINFIDKDNIALVYRYKKSISGVLFDTRKIVIININNALVKKVIDLKSEEKIYFQRYDNTLRYFVLSPVSNSSIKGNISLYSINANGENKIISKDLLIGIPEEIDFINKNNILVTIKGLSSTRKYYAIYKVEDSALKETVIYDYKIILDAQYDIGENDEYYNSKHNLWYFENRVVGNAYIDMKDSKSKIVRAFKLLYNSTSDIYSFDGVQIKNIKEAFDRNGFYVVLNDEKDLIFYNMNIFKNENYNVLNYFMIDDRYMFASTATSSDANNKQYKVIDTQYVEYSNKPTASISEITKNMETLKTYSFKASVKDEDENDEFTYLWTAKESSSQTSFNLGTTKDLSYAFTKNGAYTISLKVTDKASNTHTVSKDVIVNIAPSITQITPSTNQTASINQTLNFSANFEDADGDDLTYHWSYGKVQGTSSGSIVQFENSTEGQKNISYKFTEAGTYVFEFRVKDKYSAYITKAVQVTVKSSDVTLDFSDINLTTSQNGTVSHKMTDSNVLKLSAFKNPSHGTVSYDNSSIPNFQYSAKDCYVGKDSFIYLLNETSNKANKYGKVNISINAFEMDYKGVNKSHTLLLNEVLNDEKLMDIDSSVSVKITKAPNHGTASIKTSSDKKVVSYSYDPTDGYSGVDYFEYTLTQTKNSCTQTVNGKIDFVIGEFDTRLIQYCQEPDIGYELYKTDMSEDNTILIKDISTGTDSAGIVNTNIKIEDSTYFAVMNKNQEILWSSKGTDADTKSYNVLLNNQDHFNVLHKDNKLIFIGKRVPAKDNVYEIFKIENDELTSISKIDDTLDINQIFIVDNNIYFVTSKDGKIFVNRTNGDSIEELFNLDNSYSVNSISNIGDTLLFAIIYKDEPKLYSFGTDKKLIDLSKNDYSYQFLQKDMYKTDSLIYFLATNMNTEIKYIFQTDGTDSGTKSIHTFDGKIPYIYFNQLVLNDKLIFVGGNYQGIKMVFNLYSFDLKTKQISTLKENLLSSENDVSDANISGDFMKSIDILKDKYIFFVVKNQTSKEAELDLLLTNGTTEGTKILNSDLKVEIDGSNMPYNLMNFFELNEKYYLRVGVQYYEVDFKNTNTNLVLHDLCDTTPDDINIKILDDVELNTEQKVNITISGITYKYTNISISNGEYSLDDGVSWLSTNSKIQNNQKVYLRHTSSPNYGESTVTTLQVGTKSLEFQSITKYDNSVEGKSAVLQTGQTKSYIDFDNGYYQKGIKRSFSRENDIVTDNASGLMWQDDEKAKSLQKSVYDAEAYCKGLDLGGYSSWRLPSYDELESIVDYGRYELSLNPIFENTKEHSYYWTSTASALDSYKNWYINLHDAYEGVYNNDKALHFRCVRDIK